ncbi:CaiB/BaiF CoA transferase family protein [Serinicoccus kebangsaanensis]|uniref:CaiB/BaiF CoA transferase family protein n=1 Tax=Serinicoccus kebangsaanensis TaxID=2602069 RepID=UPI00124C098C|nr:CaiB/BaiF CoA-transferase family protein [Serinicoccus kebangsaanensis]
MSGPLDGVTVLDFTERVQGPYATQMLGDFGAEVIKVERPSALTPDGRADERYQTPGEPAPTSLYRATFLANNRNKRSVVLDLKSADGVRAAQRLARSADVLYENFRPGVLDRLGLGYDELAVDNPGLVYVSASGYGPDGPYRDRPGQDVLAQALSGLGQANRAPDGRPLPVGLSITDVLGGLNGAAAALAALIHRQRTGEGQRVHVDLLGSALAALSEHLVHLLNSDAPEPERRTAMHGHGYIPPPYGFYATADGYLALSSGRQIPQICEVLGLPDLTEDPRFADFAVRDEHREEMEQLMESRLRTRSTAEWMELMVARDIYAAPVLTLDEAARDPQVTSTGRIVTVEGRHGPVHLVAPPARFSGTPLGPPTSPPAHGEHTEQVLSALAAGSTGGSRR